MMDLFREAAVGQVIRYITKNRVLQYPEEKPDFHWAPLDKLLAEESEKYAHLQTNGHAPYPPRGIDAEAIPESTVEDPPASIAEEKSDAAASIATEADHEEPLEKATTAARSLSRTSSKPYTTERFDIEHALETDRTKSMVLVPTKTADGTILVDWYTTDDPANPQNFSSGTKSFVLTLLCLYSLAAYAASSMYVSGEAGIQEEFHVGSTAGALGLAIFVVGYGVGPLLFAPLSEIAAVGRNWIYAPTFFLFVILSIPTALVKNYAGLLVLRFLTGVFSSPSLANGGASIGDMVSSIYVHTLVCCYLSLIRLVVLTPRTPRLPLRMDRRMLLGPRTGPRNDRLRRHVQRLALGPLGNRLALRPHPRPLPPLLPRNHRRQYPAPSRAATPQTHRPHKPQIEERDRAGQPQTLRSISRRHDQTDGNYFQGPRCLVH